jgi:hypothetical protein
MGPAGAANDGKRIWILKAKMAFKLGKATATLYTHFYVSNGP